jgi:RNA polymerase sigma-70 factor (ECF subfamily)
MDRVGELPVDFRAAWGRLVGVLTRTHRLADPSHAEDAVQHAMLQALRLWPSAGLPAQPVAWLTTVARHHLLDALRAQGRVGSIDPTPDDTPGDARRPRMPEPLLSPPEPAASGEVTDDELALVFACCDPALPVASQLALALKTVCGFNLREIAAGLLSDEAAVAQRLARARRILAARRQPVALPAGVDLPPRRDAALQAIHLLFNEGYAATTGEGPAQRPDLCREAIRLARALAAHPAAAHPDADALAATLLMQGAWLGVRVDPQGDWRLLDEHDRSQWDPAMIAAGLAHLQRAQRAPALSVWHLRAGIAAEHATAPSLATTRWDVILRHYEALVTLDPSPGTRLARAVALAHADGPEPARAPLLALLPDLPPGLQAHGQAALAEVLRRLDRRDEARRALDAAVALAPTSAARRLLERRRASLGG